MADSMETAIYRKALEQVEEQAAQMVVRQPQEQERGQEKQKVKQQGQIVPLLRNPCKS